LRGVAAVFTHIESYADGFLALLITCAIGGGGRPTTTHVGTAVQT
jgi:hypothetical protein